jgi:hypothetical protein
MSRWVLGIKKEDGRMEEKWWNRRKGSWRYRRFDLS